MFELTIPILKSTLGATLVLACTLMVFRLGGTPKFAGAAYVCAVLAMTTAIAVAYFLLPMQTDRRSFEGIVASLAAAGAAVLAGLLWLAILSPRQGKEKSGAFLSKWAKAAHSLGVLAMFPLLLSIGIDLALAPEQLMGQETTITTAVIWRVIAALVALILAITISTVIARVSNFANLLITGLTFTSVLAIIAIERTAIALQMLVLGGLLKATPSLFKLTATLINSADPLFYALTGGLFASAVITWFVRERPPIETARNPAEARLMKARRLRENRLLASSSLVVLFAAGFVSSEPVFAEKAIELSPATKIEAVDGVIELPAKMLRDKELHRFTYTAKDGAVVRFIVAYKGSGVFGSGLDTCENCGAVGYYMRDKEIVCKNCDSLISAATLGFPGGCNPIPVKNTVKGQIVTLEQADLESHAEVF